MLHQHQGIQVLLLFVWLLLVYMELPFAISPTRSIPSFPLLLMLPVVLPIALTSSSRSTLYFGLGLLVPAILSAVMAWGSLGFGQLVVRLAQYAYSIFMACITLHLVLAVSASVVRKALFIMCSFMVVGILLERLGVISPITAAFRTLYEGTAFGGEIDSGREESLVGFVRPIFFTSEPSLVGMGFFAFMSAFLLVNNRPQLDLAAPLAMLVVFIALGSPSILLAMVFWALVMSARYKVSWLAWGIGLAAFGALAWLTVQSGIATTLWESLVIRFQEEIFQEGTSLYSRIFLPFTKTLPLTLQQHPLFGVGYGNHAGVSALFGYRGELDPFENQFIIGSNATANFVTYMGIVGLLINLAAIGWMAKQIRVKYLLLLFVFWLLLGQTIGTFSPPRFWCYFSLVMACMVFFNSSHKKAIDASA